MAESFLHVGATINCPHGGRVSIHPSHRKARVGGQEVATLADTYTITGCPFTVPPGKAQPCVTVEWPQQAMQVKVNGQPVNLKTSSGICRSAEGVPQGPPMGIVTQTKVGGK